MRAIYFFYILILLPFFSIGQAPSSIPYQAIVRNAAGEVLSNSSITITFKIHQDDANGLVLFEENHNITTNGQGLVALNIGNGNEMFGSIATIDWKETNKFLQVLINTGDGLIDLGTQQMMSVPYALYANDIDLRVSTEGDTLFIGNQYTIVPGVSLANLPPVNNVLDADGNSYTSVIIGTQEWLAQNLKTTKYCNGDNILTGLESSAWSTTLSGAWCYYNDDPSMDAVLGKLYNFYAATDSRNVCPCGWHVPSATEWNTLTNFLGGLASAGGQLKSLDNWDSPNTGATNSTGFGAQGGGYRFSNGTYGQQNRYAYFWSTNTFGSNAKFRRLYFNSSSVEDVDYPKRGGFSVRCLKD